MGSEKWPTFLAGFVLGALVAAAALGGFGLQEIKEARAAEAAARAEAEVFAERAVRALKKCARLEKELERMRDAGHP